jgi:hypothetical protein
MPSPSIRVAHFAYIRTQNGNTHYYQNFFFGGSSSTVAIPGTSTPTYSYAPFRPQGSTAALGGDNPAMQLLFPHTAFSIALVEAGEGNRLSQLELKTIWMANTGDVTNYSAYSTISQYPEYYIGVGASFSDTTIELRFRSAMDSVGAGFPGQQVARQNAGILPLNADLVLQ